MVRAEDEAIMMPPGFACSLSAKRYDHDAQSSSTMFLRALSSPKYQIMHFITVQASRFTPHAILEISDISADRKCDARGAAGAGGAAVILSVSWLPPSEAIELLEY